MSEIIDFVDELRKIHEADAWHGMALREALADLSPEQAAARPLSDAHSIWEIVNHITGWEDVFRRRLEGESVSEPEAGDFPAPRKIAEDEWIRTIVELDSVHERLLKLVSGFSDSMLESAVANKRSYTVRFLLHSIIRHHVYHTGQVALLRKAFRGA
jgi:uncharacterized damage-inducible protein DinB